MENSNAIKAIVKLYYNVKSAVGKTREEIVEQGKAQGESVRDFASYVPIGN